MFGGAYLLLPYLLKCEIKKEFKKKVSLFAESYFILFFCFLKVILFKITFYPNKVIDLLSEERLFFFEEHLVRNANTTYHSNDKNS